VNQRLASFIFVILFILVGCGSGEISTEVPVTQTVTEVIPSSTLIPTETQTSIPTATLIKPTPTLYLMPFPTLSIEQERIKFYQFYNFINGCRLPCLWGITPGVTTWTEVKQFINQFNSWNSIEKVEGSITKSSTFDIYAWYVKHPSSDADYAVPVFLEVQNNVISAIQIDGELASYLFPLHKLLDEYGQPEKILIKTSKQAENPLVYFADIYVVYEDKHILSTYEFIGSGKTNPVKLCLYNVQLNPLILWANDKELNVDFSALKPLGEFSELNAETFYKKFRSKVNKCLSVSSDAWN